VVREVVSGLEDRRTRGSHISSSSYSGTWASYLKSIISLRVVGELLARSLFSQWAPNMIRTRIGDLSILSRAP